MPGAVTFKRHPNEAATVRATREPVAIRLFLIGLALLFLWFFLVLPLVLVFAQAFASGVRPYLEAIREPAAISAIQLTLITAAIAVPLNIVFGVVAAWAIAKFNFLGKSVLITLIDLPFAV